MAHRLIKFSVEDGTTTSVTITSDRQRAAWYHNSERTKVVEENHQ